MKSELIRDVLEVVRKEKIINKIIGILNRKKYHSEFITQVVTIDDVKDLSKKYLKILDDNHFFDSLELGVPGKDFEPDQLIYLEYYNVEDKWFKPELKSSEDKKLNRLCIFTIIPKQNFFKKYFNQDDDNNNQSELVVLFNSKVVFKSNVPIWDINYHKKTYSDLELLHMSWSKFSPQNIIRELYKSKNGKPIDQKEHSEKLEKAVSIYLDSSKAIDNISLIRIATEFFSSVSIAKLNLGWVEGLEIILKHEFLKDIDVDKEKRKQHILELERVQNEIYSEKVRSLQTSEENFDLGRFKK